MMGLKFSGDDPEYLGDDVYASFDGFGIWLETSNGIEILNKIYLEPSVLMNLDIYRRSVSENKK